MGMATMRISIGRLILMSDSSNIQDMLNLTSVPLYGLDYEQKKLSDNFVKQTSIDAEIFELLTDKSEKLRKSLTEGEESLNSFEYLARDLFASIYKKEPEAVDQEDLSETGKINSRIMGQAFNNNLLSNLREGCSGNLLHSGIALGNTLPELVSIIQAMAGKQKEAVDQFNDINNMEQKIKMLQALADRAKSPEKKKKAHDLQNQLQQQIQLAAQAIDQNAMKQISQVIGERMSDVMEKANKETKKNKESLSAWGLEDTINPERIPLEEKREAIERIRSSSKIKKFTESVGKMRVLAKAAFKRKQPHIKIEIEGIQIGSNISNILPQELMKLANPTLKTLLFKDFLENNLLEYEKSYSEESGRGPIVCNLDESGSMAGEKEIWSKAVVVGLLELAQLQKRDFCICSFGTNVIREFEFPKGKVNVKDLLDIVEIFADSDGTQFEPPLKWSMEKIQKNKIFKKADIVFITDGESTVNSRFIDIFKKFKAKNEVSCFSIMIEEYNNYRLTPFSDKVINVSDFIQSSQDVSGIFNQIAGI
jgi:uncharacterized protein with von Willebrand factor type A (vWA) domain